MSRIRTGLRHEPDKDTATQGLFCLRRKSGAKGHQPSESVPPHHLRVKVQRRTSGSDQQSHSNLAKARFTVHMVSAEQRPTTWKTLEGTKPRGRSEREVRRHNGIRTRRKDSSKKARLKARA
jgi:hypothetical protein